MVLEHGAPDPADLTGATVTLTLDTAIQLAAEKERAKAVKTSGAVGGWALAMDVNSGAVLALAGNPALDANKPGREPLVGRARPSPRWRPSATAACCCGPISCRRWWEPTEPSCPPAGAKKSAAS